MDNTFQKMTMLTICFILFLKDLITFYLYKIRTITHKNKLQNHFVRKEKTVGQFVREGTDLRHLMAATVTVRVVRKVNG